MVEEMYTVHREPLLKYCIVLCRDIALAEDIVHNTFMRAIAHMDDLMELKTPQIRSWLYKTARNLFYDHVRRVAIGVERDRPVSDETFEVGYGDMEIQMLLSVLPYDLRILFSRRYLEGYTSSELSKMYDIPPATIRGKLMKARKLLKAYLMEE